MFLGPQGSPCLRVSVKNANVQKGEHFEVRVVQFSPNLTADGFRGISCGYKGYSGIFIQLTTWDFFISPPGMTANSNLPADYVGRISVRDPRTMRISDAKFIDEGRDFYCKLRYINFTTFRLIEIWKVAKVETVYGKQNI